MIEKIKFFLNKKNKNDNKKNIENLVVFLALLIITIIAINTIFGEKKEQKEDDTSYKVLAEQVDPNINSNKIESNEYNLQDELKDILSKIQGVGNVDVLITYSETSSISPIYNESQAISTTEEQDTEGGKRTIESTNLNKEIVFEEKNGENHLITEKIVMPKVEGAIVIAEGGRKPKHKNKHSSGCVCCDGNCYL